MNAFTQGQQRGNMIPALSRLLMGLVKPSQPTAEEQAELDRIIAHGRASVERHLGGLTVAEAQARGMLYAPGGA